MVLQALDNVGGVAYLEAQAAQNPAPFMSLLGRVLPLTLAGDKNNPIQTRVIHEDWRGVVVAAIDAQRQLPEANTAEIIDVQADSVKADKLT
jgi:hypothetical protein